MSFTILVDEFDLKEIERAANLVDSINHNPHRIPNTDGLSQSLWSIVSTIRYTQEYNKRMGI